MQGVVGVFGRSKEQGKPWQHCEHSASQKKRLTCSRRDTLQKLRRFLLRTRKARAWERQWEACSEVLLAPRRGFLQDRQ